MKKLDPRLCWNMPSKFIGKEKIKIRKQFYYIIKEYGEMNVVFGIESMVKELRAIGCTHV